MNICSMTGHIYENQNDRNVMKMPGEKYAQAYRKAGGTTDTIELSTEALEMQAEQVQEMSATSGKDTLGITRGKDKNSYIIHFYDSAMVNRAISRGYITVNGKDIVLSDEIKSQLSKIDNQAQKDREAAYQQYISEYNLKVARQQSEVWESEVKRMSQAAAIMAKMSSGAKVSGADEQFLMKYNPEMYAMAKCVSMMAARKEHQKEKRISEDFEGDKQKKADEPTGDTWSTCEWKYYETTMEVTLDYPPGANNVTKNEIILNKGQNTL